jgi:hypothetical protein
MLVAGGTFENGQRAYQSDRSDWLTDGSESL